LDISDELHLQNGWAIRAEPRAAGAGLGRAGRDPFLALIQVPAGTERLRVRPRKPGDRFRPFGMDGKSMKLSDYLINRRVPRRLRERWPLVCLGDEIVWIPGCGISDRVRHGDSGSLILELDCRKITPRMD